jgi:hypothetical protein
MRIKFENIRYMGEKRSAYRVLLGKPEGKRPLGNLGVAGRMLSIVVLKNRMGRHGLDESRSGLGQVLCCCEDGSEFSGSIKCKEFTE